MSLQKKRFYNRSALIPNLISAAIQVSTESQSYESHCDQSLGGDGRTHCRLKLRTLVCVTVDSVGVFITVASMRIRCIPKAPFVCFNCR